MRPTFHDTISPTEASTAQRTSAATMCSLPLRTLQRAPQVQGVQCVSAHGRITALGRAPAELAHRAAPLARGGGQLPAAPARERVPVPEEAGHAACQQLTSRSACAP